MRQVLKDLSLRDNPPAAGWEGPDDVYRALVPEFTTDLDEVQEVVAAIRAEIGDEHLFMAEVTAPIERLVRYYGAGGEGAHLPFNFHLIGVESTPAAIAALVERYEAALPEGAWPNWVLGNHDQPRVASRLGPGRARAAAMLLLTLRGTPTLYYGDELGLEDADVPPERVVDPDGRDPERSPMPWTGAPGRGFTRTACSRGCRSATPRSTSRRRRPTRARCSRCPVGCWRCGGQAPTSRRAPTRRSPPARPCSPTGAVPARSSRST